MKAGGEFIFLQNNPMQSSKPVSWWRKPYSKCSPRERSDCGQGGEIAQTVAPGFRFAHPGYTFTRK
jgi:hypothetical protein